jgi:hypothetical protein
MNHLPVRSSFKVPIIASVSEQNCVGFGRMRAMVINSPHHGITPYRPSLVACFDTVLLLELYFYPEDVDGMILRNVGILN